MVRRRSLCQFRLIDASLTAASSPLVNAHILRDAHEPSGKIALVETTDVFVGPEECFLSRILRRLAIGEESSAGVENRLAMSREELRKAPVIPSLPCALREFLVR